MKRGPKGPRGPMRELEWRIRSGEVFNRETLSQEQDITKNLAGSRLGRVCNRLRAKGTLAGSAPNPFSRYRDYRLLKTADDQHDSFLINVRLVEGNWKTCEMFNQLADELPPPECIRAKQLNMGAAVKIQALVVVGTQGLVRAVAAEMIPALRGDGSEPED